MKNKKIYKIVTLILMITVVFSLITVNASASVYEGENGTYYIPDFTHHIIPSDENVVTGTGLTSGQDGSFYYNTSSTSEIFRVSSNGGLRFRNKLAFEEYEYDDFSSLHEILVSSSYHLSGIEYPLLYTFTVKVSASMDGDYEWYLNLVGKKSNQLSTLDYESSVCIFSRDDLNRLSSVYDFADIFRFN